MKNGEKGTTVRYGGDWCMSTLTWRWILYNYIKMKILIFNIGSIYKYENLKELLKKLIEILGG